MSLIGQAVFSLNIAAAGNDRGFKIRARVHFQTRNRLNGSKSDKQSFKVFNSAQLARANTALNTRLESILENCFANGLLCEDVKDLLRIFALKDFYEEGFDLNVDICKVLMDLDSLESEFDTLLKISER